MYFWITILVVTLSCGQTSAVVDKRFPTNRNGDKMTNVVEKDGFLFVAENGILHELDLGLSSIKSFNTCGSDNCNNINKVLAVSGDLLVLCGTGNNGVCQAFEDDEVKYSSSSDSSDSNYLTVSTNISTPVVGIAFEGQFYLGRGNYINRTGIADNFTNNGSAYIYGGDHPVYFKNVFQHNRSISFLTNQRNNLTSNKMVSKWIRINVDKPYGANRNLSLSDKVLICQADGDDYNLLQDGAYLPAKGVLVAVFSKGDDPENPLSNSAVCVYNIEALGTVVHPISVLKLSNTRITKLKGIDRYGLYPDVFIGTYNGSVIKLSVDNSLQVHMYKTSETIDRGHPITDIHIGQDKDYVVTNRKISSFDNTECSIYKTCMETMAVRNPDCGWCLRKSTSTKNSSECSGGWISSLSECVSIDVSPKYLAVSEVAGSKITISASNFPEGLTTGMRCRYYYDEDKQVGGFITARKIGENEFTCDFIIKSKANGTFEQRVQLVAFNTTELFTYAETTIQIYECDSYTTCGDCLKSTEIDCHWCGTNLTCQNNMSTCPDKKTGKNACPRLQESEIFIPNGITKEVNLTVAHMNTILAYTCVVEQNGEIPAMVNIHGVEVPLNVSFDMRVAKINISLFLKQDNGLKKSKIENTINVTVYNCESLATDCTRCGALNESRYDCNWCQDNTCGHTSRCSQNLSCPLPQITEIEPARGGYRGGTTLTIKGTDFGTIKNSIKDVMVGSAKCINDVVVNHTSSDLDFNIFNAEIHCEVQGSPDTDRIGLQNVTFLFDGDRTGNGKYSFENPVVEKVEPLFGPRIGGTLLTLSGSHLNIERGNPTIRLGKSLTCTNVTTFNEGLTCSTPSVSKYLLITNLRFWWYEGEFYLSPTTFVFLATPNITEDLKPKSIISGGTILSTEGIHLNNTATAIVVAEYAGEIENENCVASSASSLDCRMPSAPSIAVQELKENNGAERRRRKRSTADSSSSITIKVSIKLDGYVKTFDVKYFRDPEVESFQETTSVFPTGERSLNITGEYLDLVGGITDYTISIGLQDCRVKTVERTHIICIPPQENPNKTAEKLEVVVQLGNYNKSVGYVKYVIVSDGNPVQDILVVVLPIVGGLMLVGIIAGAIGTCKYQRMKSKARQLEKNISDMEMKIKKVFRGEFLEMHSAMTHVSENLIEKGFPYNNYQRYTFLFLFPGEWHLDEHPLMREPDVPREERVNFNQGVDTFKQLLLNKFFLLSVISTMEKQRKFFVRERSIMAGHLSVALLGQMEYFHEILTVLLTTLVDETPQKQQKTLFRRCESITENMMNNWLALSLYPHVKMHSGSPLYMLFKGTQLTMESGPIDAVTGDSKYTLSEEKLLRQDDKYNTLTLKMLVENSDEIRECKVLECDTVSQVKAKCLNQIYVNYSASQLTVEPSDLDLQWHWGNSGRLLLQDEDTTSKRDGNLLQLNTMEHYKVVDGSSMALIDPAGFDKEDYANTADITIDTSGFDHHSRSKEHLTLDDLENGESIKRWHLVKPDEERQSAGCVVTDEFYITRLITTKQSVLEYMKTLFDTILDTTIPPPVKFLFDFLDNAGQRNKAQGDALHAWKSQCYLIRFWAALVDKPYYLFDQKISPYVETSMEVISQVLIESCSLKAQQYTKDSSPGKLIFKNDMMTYRERVKNYYEKVRQAKQEESELRQYLTDLNKFQRHQTHYNRHAALYSLYTQLKPYMGEILDDLEINEDTKSLGLDKKLKDLNEIMGLKQ